MLSVCWDRSCECCCITLDYRVNVYHVTVDKLDIVTLWSACIILGSCDWFSVCIKVLYCALLIGLLSKLFKY